MAKPFDVATKHLIQHNPADWLSLVGMPNCQVMIVDADLSTISAASDKVMRVKSKQPWLRQVQVILLTLPESAVARRKIREFVEELEQVRDEIVESAKEYAPDFSWNPIAEVP